MGSLRFSCFWQRDFLGSPVNLLLYSEKCQGVPFSQSVRIHYFCSVPTSVDPIRPVPSPWCSLRVCKEVVCCVAMFNEFMSPEICLRSLKGWRRLSKGYTKTWLVIYYCTLYIIRLHVYVYVSPAPIDGMSGFDFRGAQSKGIWRQGKVLKPRSSWQKSLCPVATCPYLCSSDIDGTSGSDWQCCKDRTFHVHAAAFVTWCDVWYV